MYPSFSKFLTVLFIGLFVFIAAPVHAQEADSQTLSHIELGKTPIALEGYDVVTYFIPSGPLKGSESHQAVYGEKRYLFTSAENQKKFSVDPEKYIPEFGEYCGCAASENKRVKADPEVFKITEGKLVLFENTAALSVWEKDESNLYKKAQEFSKYESKYNANKRLQDDTRVRLFTF